MFLFGRAMSGLIAVAATTALVGCSSGTSSAPAADSGAPSASTSSSPSGTPEPADGSSPKVLDRAAAQRRLASVVSSILGHDTIRTMDTIDLPSGDILRANESWSRRSGIHYGRFQFKSGSFELITAPGLRVERPVGSEEHCWLQQGSAFSSVARPLAPSLAVLRSARATRGRGALLAGSVAAMPLARLLLTDQELASDRGRAPSRARTGAQFVLAHGNGLEVDVDLARALRAVGVIPKAGNLSVRLSIGAGPDPTQTPLPAPSHILSVSESDPSWRTKLAACNARFD